MCYITLIFGLLAMGLAVIANVILFFFNVIEGFLTADHDRKQKVIVSYLKKSSAVIAIAYMVFGYLVQK